MSPSQRAPDAIARINRELRRRASHQEHDASITTTHSAIAITGACSAYRRVRSDIDAALSWAGEHTRDLLPLLLLLVEIADGACRAREGNPPSDACGTCA